MQINRAVAEPTRSTSIAYIPALAPASAKTNEQCDDIHRGFPTTAGPVLFYSSQMAGKKKIAGVAFAGAAASLGLIGVEHLTAWVPLIAAVLCSLGLFLWIDSG